ncbi:Tex family protein [Ascidiimonas sp. W6]|uniref:Tex family protein n=1 Tax=Ascidiimonas meishanensis TaxID=3128903 RepID=UPI0030EB2DFF
MNKAAFVAQTTSLPLKNITNTIKLMEQDCTIPFIARYRKEATGNLDEVAIMDIFKAVKLYDEMEKRKTAILKAIEEQNVLTPQLKENILQASSMLQLEDIYLPFKKKRKTKASVARENGLEPLAKIIMKQQDAEVENTAVRFTSHTVPSTADALQGARYIIAEWINENSRVRNRLRSWLRKKAHITSQVLKEASEKETSLKYQQYFDWSELIAKCPSHRLLAILRAENEGVVKVKIEIDKEEALDIIDHIIIKTEVRSSIDQVFMAIEDAYKRLLLPALSNEIIKEAKEKADAAAIKVFATNLRQLLLAAPLGEKRILAIDPGYKSGCKIVCLDEKGDLLHNENIYPHPPQRETSKASKKIKSLVNAYKIEAIAIGNGTASRETEAFIKRIPFEQDLQVFVVNENGASIYSASKIARQEFPNYDVTVRGAVSIGRRLADPLAELVKIDPKSIGVGQYQHDVDQNKLKNELDTVIMSCVNSVGVNVNTASAPLLSYVSGIGAVLAENIVKYRASNGTIATRKELLKIPRLGDKVFEQAAAFLRITDPAYPLDNSAVHPERYELVKKMAKDQQTTIENLIGNKELIHKIQKATYISEDIGLPTIEDIIKELEKPGRDPRKKARVFEFSKELKTINDVKPGMKVPGIVNNITNFGCFVDIGIKESGLVHISKLKNEYVSDPSTVVSLHEHVQVKVLEVDVARKRIQLSMID